MCKKSTMCDTCLYDCVLMCEDNKCQNYVLAPTTEEYWEIIHELNTNLRRICKDNNLNFKVMMDMLSNKQRFIYKYHRVLIDNLYESEENQKYIVRFDDGEK